MAVSVLGRHMENSALGVEHFGSFWSRSQPDSSMTLAEQYFATAKKTPSLLKTRIIQNLCAAPMTCACTSSSRNIVVTHKWKRKIKYTSIIISDCTGEQQGRVQASILHWCRVSSLSEVTEILTSFLLKWVSGLHHSLSVSVSMNPSQTILFQSLLLPSAFFFCLFYIQQSCHFPCLFLPWWEVLHFRSPQSCRWNLLDHRAAHAQRTSD